MIIKCIIYIFLLLNTFNFATLFVDLPFIAINKTMVTSNLQTKTVTGVLSFNIVYYIHFIMFTNTMPTLSR